MHTQFNTTIFSCIPQVCRGIPTRIHWICSSPGTNENVLAYLKLIPIANDSLEISHFLLILYEIKLPSHVSPDPFNILKEPVINPKPSSIVARPLTKANSASDLSGISDINLSSIGFSLSTRNSDLEVPSNLEPFDLSGTPFAPSNSINLLGSNLIPSVSSNQTPIRNSYCI